MAHCLFVQRPTQRYGWRLDISGALRRQWREGGDQLWARLGTPASATATSIVRFQAVGQPCIAHGAIAQHTRAERWLAAEATFCAKLMIPVPH